MQKRRFTLEDISAFLEEIGLQWPDKLLYDPNTRKYKKATITKFSKPVFVYLKKNDQTMLMLATITNESFELRQDRSRLDATTLWAEYLTSKENNNTVVS